MADSSHSSSNVPDDEFLHLSCTSSDYDECGQSDGEPAPVMEPYMFEPEYEGASDEEEEEEGDWA
jgi:hypothetical protein